MITSAGAYTKDVRYERDSIDQVFCSLPKGANRQGPAPRRHQGGFKVRSAATDLDLISHLKAIPDARMRRRVRIQPGTCSL